LKNVALQCAAELLILNPNIRLCQNVIILANDSMCFAREPEEIDQIQIMLKELHPTACARSLNCFVLNPSRIIALRDKRERIRKALNATIGSSRDVRKSLGSSSREEEGEEMQQLVNVRVKEMGASFCREHIQFTNDLSILSPPKEIEDEVIHILL